MKVYICADHRGYRLKKLLIPFLTKSGYVVTDLGNTSHNPRDDYPDFGKKVAWAVKKNPHSRGIAICGSGVGVCVAANRFRGIRAVQGLSEKLVQVSRHDDDTNVLCLAADFLDIAKAKKIVMACLETKFSGAVRHKRRIRKLES